MQVVSLVPSVTETLAEWGVVPAACTRFCDRGDLPHVGGTKNPDVTRIVALRPDLVVVDRQENRREDAEALRAAGLHVLVLDVTSLTGLPRQLAALAGAVGVDVPALELPAVAPLGGRAFVPIWRRPWMTIGPTTYGSSLLAALGVTNVFADGAAYPTVSLAEAAARRPDVVLVPSEPYEFTEAHLGEFGEVAPSHRVDGRDLFWWGARTPRAMVRLRAALAGALDLD